MCIFLSNIPFVSSRYGVEMDKLILSATSLVRLRFEPLPNDLASSCLWNLSPYYNRYSWSILWWITFRVSKTTNSGWRKSSLADVSDLYFHALGTDPKEGQATPWGYWSFDPHPLMTPENFSYSPENIQNHPGIIAQASLEGVHVHDR